MQALLGRHLFSPKKTARLDIYSSCLIILLWQTWSCITTQFLIHILIHNYYNFIIVFCHEQWLYKNHCGLCDILFNKMFLLLSFGQTYCPEKGIWLMFWTLCFGCVYQSSTRGYCSANTIKLLYYYFCQMTLCSENPTSKTYKVDRALMLVNSLKNRLCVPRNRNTAWRLSKTAF